MTIRRGILISEKYLAYPRLGTADLNDGAGAQNFNLIFEKYHCTDGSIINDVIFMKEGLMILC